MSLFAVNDPAEPPRAHVRVAAHSQPGPPAVTWPRRRVLVAPLAFTAAGLGAAILNRCTKDAVIQGSHFDFCGEAAEPAVLPEEPTALTIALNRAFYEKYEEAFAALSLNHADFVAETAATRNPFSWVSRRRWPRLLRTMG